VQASHEVLTLAHPWLTLLARCECLKRHGVGEREGELGADFTSMNMLPDQRFLYSEFVPSPP
jgi:hypothetical protein